MQNLKNKFLKIVVGWVLVIGGWFLVFVVINLIPTKLVVENKPNVETKFVKLTDYKSSFVATNDNLNRVELVFKNPNLESKDELIIFVKDGDVIIYQQSFSGFNFGDTSHARLDFGAITDSQNKKYTVEIKATKMVDGKLSFGVRNGEIETISYYKSKFSLEKSVEKSMELMQNWVLLIPLLFITLFLW